MTEIINQIMSGNAMYNAAVWIWNTIFLNWTNALLNWYNSANYTWSAIAIFIVIAVCLLELWTLGLAFAYLGPWIWVGLAPWAILWLFYLFAIPCFVGLFFAHQINKPKRWQKILALFYMLSFYLLLPVIFSPSLAVWYTFLTISYTLLLSEIYYPRTNFVVRAI